MDIILFKIAIVLTFVIFIVPKKFQYYWGLILHVALISISSYWAGSILFSGSENLKIAFMPLMGSTIDIEIDQLSAFFILIINFTMLTGALYAKSYLQPYLPSRNRIEMAFHFFNFLGLHLSMLLVVMLRDALAFLIIWEVMSLTSFFLVIFETEKKETMKIGINYLIQMHIGVVLLTIAFLLASVQSGAPFSFNGLSAFFETHKPFPLFLLFFLGFGIKAGFIPLHSWLPQAHPAAPSHVSGVMSGVMIKMGIYGILRVLTSINHDLLPIGIFILVVSLITGILGISMAIPQRDVKKLLAYSSIENIGIIGIGIGLGVLGLAEDIPVLAVLGFAGSLMHLLNHSLFKSLLFYTAGATYKQTHTRNIEQLGGIIKKMPKTALFFLLGALAICGLPPLNGFISEFILYSGMFKALQPGDLFTDIVLLFSFSGLAIIGGLALFGFTKVFSIIFLGTPRSDKALHATEVDHTMLTPFYLIGFMILFIGFFSFLLMKPLSGIVSIFTNNTTPILQISPLLNHISISSLLFIILAGIIWKIRAMQQKKHIIKQDATWGCAYQGADPAIHQYTSASYADNFGQLAQQIVNVKKEFTPFKSDEIFPDKKTFKTRSSDIFEDNLINQPCNKVLEWLNNLAIFQTGKIQHYMLYALVFIIVIALLTILNWI
jgi:formate hydrogenlyase subunit 3/multisubunit Na+/H+ antiporter MnhD subunit